MIRDQFTLDLGNELIIDNFAGGGGTSTGLEAAFGRPVDIAINHDPEALAMHALNHPYTKHLCESVWDVDPIEVTGNQPVGLVWLSPDCKHFSKAKGGTPVSKHIRGLAWVGMRWVALTKPRVLMLENVEEFQTWGPVIIAPDGTAYPDPKRKGKTFQSFVRQLRQHGYKVDWRELRACDNGAPTIRKRLFLIARRDGLPIAWPEQSHAEPSDRRVLAGKLAPFRTAAECIDFSLPAESVFGRKRDLAPNTMRRVAKGLWRHVLTSEKPFIVNTSGGPHRIHSIQVRGGEDRGEVSSAFLTEHANASNQRTMPADAPLRTICAQVKGGHFSVVAPTLAPLRGTSEAHLGGHDVQAPLSTISAGGTHHGLVGAHLITIGYGEREGQDARAQDIAGPLGTIVTANKHAMVAAHLTKFRTGSEGQSLNEPMPTVTANSFIKRPGGAAPLGIVAAHLSHLTHHGDRAGTTPAEPLPTVTGARRGEQVLVAACLEQANGGFYDGDGRAADEPMSTITATGSNQRLVTAYLVKYYSEGGQDSACNEPMHTVPTKARMGLVETLQIPAATLALEHVERARACARLLHEHLPEQFPTPADLVLMHHGGQWWVLVDITLRMLKPPELYRAQSFPGWYIHHEIPDPKLLFVNGIQVPGDPRLLPRIPLTITAQVRMCGNSVSPIQAEAITRSNFAHEQLLQRVVA